MAKQTVKAKKDAESAKVSTQANEAQKANAETLAASDPATVRPEDGLYMADGQPVETNDGKQYTLAMLNELETGQTADNSAGRIEELEAQLKTSDEALAAMESDRDMWKQRAQDAEVRLQNIKSDMPRDSMGLPRVVPPDAA